ncbi:MAG: putative thiamine pyrophosphokinae [Actinomycetota bacterium]
MTGNRDVHPSTDTTVVVVTGAAALSADAASRVPAGAIVLAADGGLDHALAAGLTPAGLIGDLDSVSEDGLAWARDHATIDRHDPDKDRTDTELALAMAAEFAPDRLVLLSGGGDRLDHLLAVIGALGDRVLTAIPHVDGWWGDERFHVLHGPGQLRLEVEEGALVSLLATHGSAGGVTTTGLRWPLDDHDLEPLAGHGVSNEAVQEHVEVRVRSGVLTVFVRPPEPSHRTGHDGDDGDHTDR